jgi:hypothetical protein
MEGAQQAQALAPGLQRVGRRRGGDRGGLWENQIRLADGVGSIRCSPRRATRVGPFSVMGTTSRGDCRLLLLGVREG